jgi:hypothetical protein
LRYVSGALPSISTEGVLPHLAIGRRMPSHDPFVRYLTTGTGRTFVPKTAAGFPEQHFRERANTDPADRK